MHDETHDHDDEQVVEDLRRILLPVDPLPLGMKSRFEARLQREARTTRAGGVASGILGLAAFLGGCAIVGPEGFAGWAWTLSAVGGVVYSLGVRSLLDRRS